MTETVDAAQIKYRTALQSRILDVLSTGKIEIPDLIKRCHGAFPTEVMRALSALRSSGAITESKVEHLVLDPPLSKPAYSVHSKLEFLEGNPLLCSWYFTEDSCRRIAQMRTWSSARIAFLGTPRLFDFFRSMALGKSRVLVELDELVVKTLRKDAGDTIIQHDLNDPLPDSLNGEFDCVFFDPPWYPSEYSVWLDRATSLAPNGYVFFSLFRELTRPTAASEREHILAQAESSSRDLLSLRSFVSYEVPSFERAQLQAAGFHEIRPWRIADFIELRLHPSYRRCAKVPLNQQESRGNWSEVDVGAVRFFVSMEARSKDAELLSPADPESLVLQSPSRREPVRIRSNVLTSRGHGLVTGNPEELLSLLKALGSSMDEDPKAAIEHISVQGQTRELLKSILLEQPNG